MSNYNSDQLIEKQFEIVILRQQVKLLRDALSECKKLNGMDRPISCAKTVDEALAATEPKP